MEGNLIAQSSGIEGGAHAPHAQNLRATHPGRSGTCLRRGDAHGLVVPHRVV